MSNRQNEKKKKITATLTIVFNVILLVVALAELHIRDVDSLESIRAMNAGMDFIAMLIGLIILICCYIDMQRGGVDYRFFRYLVEVTYIGLFTDLSAWMMKDQPEFWLLNRIDNSIFFLVMPFTVFFYWHYTIQIIGKEDSWIGRFEFWLRVGLVLEVVLCVINFWMGFFFTVDHNGSYKRGELFPFFMLFIVLAGTAEIILVIRHRKQLKMRQIIAFAVYVGTPFPVILISIFVYGLSLNYIVCMLDTLLMYCILNVEQGREKMVVEKELATAKSIQAGVLPHHFPLFPERKEFDIYASMDPAKEVGGDFYDVFMIDDDHLALVIADVSGKGIPASLFMLIAKTLIKNGAQMGGTPAEILTYVNQQLLDGNEAKMFVTVWLGILTISTGHVIEVNAGHEKPVIYTSGGRFELLRRKHGFVCGARKKITYTDDEFDLSPGDMLFVYTDGVPEATNGNGKRYGEERMMEALNKNIGSTPEQLLKKMHEDVDSFVKSAEQFDDLTMLALTYYGEANRK